MAILVKVSFICVIFAVNIIAPPPPRAISRTNSAPELNRPRSTPFATRSHGRPTASSSSSSKTRNNVHFQSDVARRLSDDLNEALLATTGEHLNPSRDGYYARVNRVLARYGVGVVVGSAVGIGAVKLYNQTTVALETTTTTTSTTTEENSSLVI